MNNTNRGNLLAYALIGMAAISAGFVTVAKSFETPSGQLVGASINGFGAAARTPSPTPTRTPTPTPTPTPKYCNSDQTWNASCGETTPPGVNTNDWQGPVVTVTIPAGTYCSNSSPSGLDQKAKDDAKSQARAGLQCHRVYHCTTRQSATASCPAGSHFPDQGKYGRNTYTDTSVTTLADEYDSTCSNGGCPGYLDSTVSAADACTQAKNWAQDEANRLAAENCEPIGTPTPTPTPSSTPSSSAANRAASTRSNASIWNFFNLF